MSHFPRDDELVRWRTCSKTQSQGYGIGDHAYHGDDFAFRRASCPATRNQERPTHGEPRDTGAREAREAIGFIVSLVFVRVILFQQEAEIVKYAKAGNKAVISTFKIGKVGFLTFNAGSNGSGQAACAAPQADCAQYGNQCAVGHRLFQGRCASLRTEMRMQLMEFQVANSQMTVAKTMQATANVCIVATFLQPTK